MLDSGAPDEEIQCVALGNPHFSETECALLAELVSDGGGPKHPEVAVVATMGRQVFEHASEQGLIDVLQRFGVHFITDTCWCMLTEPVVPVHARTLITNSAKYAHYAPGLVGKRVRMANLRQCTLHVCLRIYPSMCVSRQVCGISISVLMVFLCRCGCCAFRSSAALLPCMVIYPSKGLFFFFLYQYLQATR